MKPRVSRFQEDPRVIDSLLLRDRLGFKKYQKRVPRDRKKTELLIQLALARMTEQERTDYIVIGNRKRKVTTAGK